MMTAAAVMTCALSLLGSRTPGLAPIELLTARPADVTPYAVAFIRRNPDRIYVLTTSGVFQSARRRTGAGCDTTPFRIIASAVVHEDTHLRYGSGERAAYEAQLAALMNLGSGPESDAFKMVLRAMNAVLAAEAVSVGVSVPLDGGRALPR